MGRKVQDTQMTRFVIEQGRMAPSVATLARGGKPAVAASVHACNQCGRGRRGLDLPRGIRRLWRPSADQGQQSPLAGARFSYSAPAKPSSDLALG